MSSISDATKILATEVKSMSKIFTENQKILISLKTMIDTVSSSLEQNVANLRVNIDSVASKTEPLHNLSFDIRDIGIELGSLVRKTDSLAALGGDIRNIGIEFVNFRENILGKTKQIDEKMTDLAEMLNSNVASTSEFHKKTNE